MRSTVQPDLVGTTKQKKTRFLESVSINQNRKKNRQALQAGGRIGEALAQA
jgi:hypothetical protein